MGQLRTANKRHKRAVLALQTRKKPSGAAPAVSAKPAKVAG